MTKQSARCKVRLSVWTSRSNRAKFPCHQKSTMDSQNPSFYYLQKEITILPFYIIFSTSATYRYLFHSSCPSKHFPATAGAQSTAGRAIWWSCLGHGQTKSNCSVQSRGPIAAPGCCPNGCSRSYMFEQSQTSSKIVSDKTNQNKQKENKEKVQPEQNPARKMIQRLPWTAPRYYKFVIQFLWKENCNKLG